jgi:hypothetical protein
MFSQRQEIHKLQKGKAAADAAFLPLPVKRAPRFRHRMLCRRAYRLVRARFSLRCIREAGEENDRISAVALASISERALRRMETRC